MPHFFQGMKEKQKYVHSLEELDEIRRLIKEKKYYDADVKTGESMHEGHAQSYLSAGNIYIETENVSGEISDYARSLNLETAVYESKFYIDGEEIKREAFVSKPENIMVYSIECKKQTFSIYTSCELIHTAESKGNKIIVSGIRRGSTFIAKKYTRTPWHLVETIDEILPDGQIITRVRE